MSSIERTVHDVFDTLCHMESLVNPQCEETTLTVFLMRGLPSCGKSFTSRQLAGEQGTIIETDAFFVRETPNGTSYEYEEDRLAEARNWSLKQFRHAIRARQSPIVVDRGNGRNWESKIYLEIAINNGYEVRIAEPSSPWWNEIKTLLRYRPHTDAILDHWADRLAEISLQTHNVPARTIRHWMDSWWDDLTIEDILSLDESTETPDDAQLLSTDD